ASSPYRRSDAFLQGALPPYLAPINTKPTGRENMSARFTKRLLLAAAGLAIAVAIASPSWAKELRILAWQGYADDDWVQEFKGQCGCDVSVVFIGTDDEIWAKIKGSEGKDFDLFAVNTAQLQRYIDAGLTTPIDLDKIPNQKQTLPRFQD